jgi:hypothetical protein
MILPEADWCVSIQQRWLVDFLGDFNGVLSVFHPEHLPEIGGA